MWENNFRFNHHNQEFENEEVFQQLFKVKMQTLMCLFVAQGYTWKRLHGHEYFITSCLIIKVEFMVTERHDK